MTSPTVIAPTAEHRLPPLLVHVIFHPRAQSARALAEAIHGELNSDPLVPGLRIPTSCCSERDDAAPPPALQLDQAQRSFVAVLAEEEINIADDWCGFVAETWTACQSSRRHRCVPFQLAPEAWPLDDRLDGVNFVRAFDLPEAETRALVIRRLVIELCRFLSDLPGASNEQPSEAPTRIFVSHTKLDVDAEPQVVKQLVGVLTAEQQNKTWFDSGDTSGGSLFAEKIESGVQDSSLLCVLTDNYASREWCRREVLCAKRLQRPILVVDALASHETRSFPYLGNVPVVRWDGDPQKPIDQLLKETLRIRHGELMLERDARPDDVRFSRPPELITAADLTDKSKQVLYPDPPLGVEEAQALTSLGIAATTPLSRLADDAGLAGKRIAMSMSPSNDVHQYGFSPTHLREAMLDLSRYLLISGATLVYGGHLGEKGYTLALTELVRTHNRIAGIKPVERLQVYLPWPLPVSDAERSRYKEVAQINRVPRPSGIDESLHPDFIPEPSRFDADASPLHRYAFAKGMTEMRTRTAQDDRIVARIVLGGPAGPVVAEQPGQPPTEQWYRSRIPGVLEEVWLATQAHQPVFLIGAFGGVGALVMDIIDGRERREMTWDYQRRAPHAVGMRRIYEERHEQWVDYPEIASELRRIGLPGLNPLLSEEQHRDLCTTRDVNRMVELVLAGLSTTP